MAAEIADGWLPLYYSPFRPEVYAESLAAAKPGLRDRGAVQLSAITDDIEAALMPSKASLGFYIGGMGAEGANFHKDLMARMGFEEEADEIQDLFLEGKRDEAIATGPDRVRGRDLARRAARAHPRPLGRRGRRARSRRSTSRFQDVDTMRQHRRARALIGCDDERARAATTGDLVHTYPAHRRHVAHHPRRVLRPGPHVPEQDNRCRRVHTEGIAAIPARGSAKRLERTAFFCPHLPHAGERVGGYRPLHHDVGPRSGRQHAVAPTHDEARSRRRKRRRSKRSSMRTPSRTVGSRRTSSATTSAPHSSSCWSSPLVRQRSPTRATSATRTTRPRTSSGPTTHSSANACRVLESIDVVGTTDEPHAAARRDRAAPRCCPTVQSLCGSTRAMARSSNPHSNARSAGESRPTRRSTSSPSR